MKVFVSVGAAATTAQEDFIRCIEDRLRAEGLNPRTVGRNTFSSDSPLVTVANLMNQCCGTVVIALERQYFPAGRDRPGGANEKQLFEVRLPTPWNQIEAAMAYSRGHPLLVIVDERLHSQGLLEPGYDWFVQRVSVDRSSLSTAGFNGILANWKSKLARTNALQSQINPTDLTIGDLVSRLQFGQGWAVLGALAGLLCGAFAVGIFIGKLHV